MAIIEKEFMELTKGLDLEWFWEENQRSRPLTPDKPRCPISFAPDDHWLFEFVQIPSTMRYYQDKTYRDHLHREVNQITREFIGVTFFDEDTWEYSPKRIENLFGCEFTYTEGGTPWLTPVTDNPQEFHHILDRAEKTDITQWALPEAYRKEWEMRQSQGRSLPLLGTGSRGPATIMTSVLTAETVFYWIYDYPDLIRRFRDILAVKMVELNQFFRRFSGNTQLGWWITDDNCALFNRKLYREFCYPVLEKVLNAMAPDLPGRDPTSRYQHSDSAMGHLLDFQRELGINIVNYGPEVDVALIRAKMPDALIKGQMPPMLLRNGSPDEIRERVIEDFSKAGASGRLEITTAGSLAAGTGVGRMRWFMQCVQDSARYKQ